MNSETEIFIKNLKLPIKSLDSAKEIENERKHIDLVDKSLLFDKNICYSCDELKEIPNGRFNIKHKGVEFECVFNFKQEKSLYVVLNGSKTSQVPEFKRWSWYRFFKGSMLNIADPMYRTFENLNLGWYYGTKGIDYRQILSEVVLKICNILGIENDNIYFYGSSGGGTAAIHLAGLVERSTAIAIVPQLFLNDCFYTKSFEKATGINLSENDDMHRNDMSYFLTEKKNSNYLLVENINGQMDMSQIIILGSKMKKDFYYGIQRFGNVGIWMYDADTKYPHNAQEYKEIYFTIDFLAKSLRLNSNWEELENLYLLFSEFWHNHWKDAEKISYLESSKRKTIQEVITYNDNDYNIEYFNESLLINESGDIYNSIILIDELKRNKTYKLTITNVKHIVGDHDYFDVALKDKKLNYVISSKRFKFGEKYEFAFLTDENANNIQLKIYAGSIGESNNKSIKLNEITVVILSEFAD